MQELIWIFTDDDYLNASNNNSIIKDVINLYNNGFRVPNHNAYKLLDNGSYEIFNFKSIINPSYNQNVIVFKINYLDNLTMHLNVQKISLTPVVILGNKTSFIIRVTNDCDYVLNEVFVIEDKYDGLIYDSWDNNPNWTYSINNDGKSMWTYNLPLDSNESAEFTVFFNTTRIGNFTNFVVAGSNQTNNTTTNNTTEVRNDTPPNNHTSKKPNNNIKHYNQTYKKYIGESIPSIKTGLPIIILLIALVSLIIPFRRKK
ncbi:MAG: hypothetical protein PUC09_05045 [Methanobrevibacter wolinii]|nr:hypothetical protein [Methanobrevibacter wolinii]